MNGLSYIKTLTSPLLLSVALAACGGGGSSSGGGSNFVDVTIPPPQPPPTLATMPGEFAIDCVDMVQVRTNRTALVQNICPYAINVRQTNSRFDTPSPVTEIGPGQIVAVALGDDQTSIGLGACRAPSIPESADPGFFTCSAVPTDGAAKAYVYPVRWFD